MENSLIPVQPFHYQDGTVDHVYDAHTSIVADLPFHVTMGVSQEFADRMQAATDHVNCESCDSPTCKLHGHIAPRQFHEPGNPTNIEMVLLTLEQAAPSNALELAYAMFVMGNTMQDADEVPELPAGTKAFSMKIKPGQEMPEFLQNLFKTKPEANPEEQIQNILKEQHNEELASTFSMQRVEEFQVAAPVPGAPYEVHTMFHVSLERSNEMERQMMSVITPQYQTPRLGNPADVINEIYRVTPVYNRAEQEFRSFRAGNLVVNLIILRSEQDRINHLIAKSQLPGYGKGK